MEVSDFVSTTVQNYTRKWILNKANMLYLVMTT